MPRFQIAMDEISEHLKKVAQEIDTTKVDEMISTIISASRIFIFGAGRSGLVGRAFAMRLMHLGFQVFVIGETVTPSMKKGDVLIAISGSGETSSVVQAVQVANKIGSKIIGITSNIDSVLGKLANVVILVKGRTKLDVDKNYVTRQILGQRQPLSPLGTLFEVSVLVFLDGIIAELMEKLGKTEKDLKEMHPIVE
ncbi:MAG: 6-phospho-3-hexuloisomerase [Euryarchaeota archaeon]|nr:6-phospho-3-hexuloisomerase [Euryarchaeota archaeon]